MTSDRLGSAARRRLKLLRKKEKDSNQHPHDKSVQIEGPHSNDLPEGVEIEYVTAPLAIPESDPSFAGILARFTAAEDDGMNVEEEYPGADQHPTVPNSHDDSFGEEDGEPRLSKKKLKKQSRLTVAQLKQLASRPEVVEWEDVTAKDPRTLVQLKSVRHSVSVPGHWSRKRKYLAGKRGFVKPPFELPQFIKDTGIMELRQSALNEDATKRQKVKAREKMHPKLGKITVDYEKLHDAFFKYQTKPLLTSHGNMYYEGKEFEGRSRDSRPGYLSEALRSALGMGHLAPPPWLHAIQKYGAPPSYPHMRIPGFNAAIPEGAQWGFHPGGWGKPPVDTFVSPASMAGRPDASRMRLMLTPVEQNIWGELEPDREEASYYLDQGEEDGEAFSHQVREMTLDEDQAEAYAYQQQEQAQSTQYHAAPIESLGPETIEAPRSRRR